MDSSSLICVDLGSAYTKVAARKDWDAKTELANDPDEDTEWAFCFPSVVASVDRRGTLHWLTGKAALAQAPGAGIEIYRDWKADFFGPGKSVQAIGEQVASHFFAGLRDHLSGVGFGKLIKRSPIRLCIPKLEGCEKRGKKLVEIAASVGFNPPEKSQYIFEPASNAYGVLTRGRNYTWKPKKWLPLHPSFHRIFEPTPRGLFAQIRSAARGRKSLQYTVLIIDIGSFTTDVGSITFTMKDGDIDEIDRPTVEQSSKRLGVRDLDSAVLDVLPSAFRKAIDSRPLGDWERNKQQLYLGRPVRVRSASGDRLEVGSESEQRAISGVINRFAEKIGKMVTEFCKEHELTAQESILTGGGAAITPLRAQVIGTLGTRVGGITDLLDPDEPMRVLLEKRTPRGWEHDKKQVDERVNESHNLLRGGSAIGGCSVVIDLP